MVAIEHRQKSAIIATDTPTPTAISSSSSSEVATTIETLANTTSSRRSSDIVNSNDIAVLSPTSSTNSSSITTVITTTNTATSNIIFVAPKDNIKDNQVEEIEEEKVQHSSSPKLDKSPAKMSQSSSEASTATAESAAVSNKQAQTNQEIEPVVSKSAVSQRNVDIKIAKESNKDIATQELTKKVLKLDLTGKDLDEYSIKSPKSPIATRLPHQSSLTTVDVEDRKTLREALYQGIFHRHRRTIFAVGSFLRMLRSRNSSYNTIRSSSEGEDVDETR